MLLLCVSYQSKYRFDILLGLQHGKLSLKKKTLDEAPSLICMMWKMTHGSLPFIAVLFTLFACRVKQPVLVSLEMKCQSCMAKICETCVFNNCSL